MVCDDSHNHVTKISQQKRDLKEAVHSKTVIWLLFIHSDANLVIYFQFTHLFSLQTCNYDVNTDICVQ